MDGRRESNPLLLGASEVLGALDAFIPLVGSTRRCGRMESNHHSTRHRVYSAGSSPVAQRPQVRGWPTGFEPAPRGSQPRVLPSTPRPPEKRSNRQFTRSGAGTTGLEPAASRLTSECSARLSYAPEEVEGGIGSPQPEAETLPSVAPEPAVTHRRSCQRVSAPPPPHRSALEACRSQLHVRARALHQPLFRHFLGPPVGRPIVHRAGGIRTHDLELMRLARTAAPLPRKSGWQESNLRSPAPEAGGVATLPYSQSSIVEYPRRGSNPQLPG